MLEQTKMGADFDTVLKKYVGQFGKYQKLQLLLMIPLLNFVAVHSGMNSVFIAAKPEFHCKPTGMWKICSIIIAYAVD